jgi:cyanate permease
LGPVIAGVVRDLTGSFHAALALLPAIAIAMIALAAIAPELVSERERTMWRITRWKRVRH